jgi:S1-C subfamily serine protease
MQDYLKEKAAEEKLVITLLRDGKEIEVAVRLAER